MKSTTRAATASLLSARRRSSTWPTWSPSVARRPKSAARRRSSCRASWPIRTRSRFRASKETSACQVPSLSADKGFPLARARTPYPSNLGSDHLRIASMRAVRLSWWSLGLCIAVSAGVGAVMAQGQDAEPPEPPLGLPPILWPDENPYTPEKRELGWLLYFDTRLSSDKSVSCASCHRPEKGFTDGAAV